MKRLLLTAACLAVLTAAAPAHATTETATSGPLTATFSYDDLGSGQYDNLALRISNGTASVDIPVTSPGCGSTCWPGGFDQNKSVRIRDLDGDGQNEVLLDLFTGGAHCCSIAQIYKLDPTSTGGTLGYAKTENNFLDPGYELTDLNGDGIPEFKSADGTFAYLLSSFAGSGFPLQIFRYRDGGLVDVTREYPKLIGSDAAHYWRAYRKYIGKKAPYNDRGHGALAAWVGDQYLLGQGAAAQRELKAARKRGWIRTGEIRTLNKQLTDSGYR